MSIESPNSICKNFLWFYNYFLQYTSIIYSIGIRIQYSMCCAQYTSRVYIGHRSGAMLAVRLHVCELLEFGTAAARWLRRLQRARVRHTGAGAPGRPAGTRQSRQLCARHLLSCSVLSLRYTTAPYCLRLCSYYSARALQASRCPRTAWRS